MLTVSVPVRLRVAQHGRRLWIVGARAPFRAYCAFIQLEAGSRWLTSIRERLAVYRLVRGRTTRSFIATSRALDAFTHASTLRDGSARYARYCLSACSRTTFASIVLAFWFYVFTSGTV